MNWTEICIKVKSDDVDRVSAIANMSVPYGIYIEDYSDLIEQSWEIAHVDLIEQELLEKDRNYAIIHIYISEEDNATEAAEYIKELLSASSISFELVSSIVNDSTWADGWKKYFKCTEIGEKLVIRPSWEEYDNKSGRKVLSIDPGAAFGTGTHATTSLCLEILEKHINNESSVLDIGCGSGILAIAGVLLGAKSAVGVDIDAQSVKVARENAEINAVTDKTQFLIGDLAEEVSGKYSVVCANIVADVIIKLLRDVADYMDDSAILVTSGIINIRRDDVVEGFKKYGFTIVEEHNKDNWYAFVCKKGE
ncbi:MAG: 50S ribosomal protein L11 methyltransferase [Acutalibacteraceae bacterium]|nr:50S ribosomal protein L11 methyltransferase [Acutalibacteraceae bacterium]